MTKLWIKMEVDMNIKDEKGVMPTLIFNAGTLKTLIAFFGTNAKVADVIEYFKKGGKMNGTAN